ncbi:MAG: type II secretion system minor pseudopilin GspK [Gammaproteobacteria bacterium]|jgi:general secretion pathway protein K
MVKSRTLRIPGSHQRSQGVALIMAILITSLVSIAAVAMITQQQLDIRRTQNILHFDQAYIYVLGAEEWAKGFLAQDESPDYDFYPVSEKDIDVIGLPIAEEIKQSGLDIGGISGIITDASAGFPLNNLVDANGARDDAFWHVFDQLVANTLQFNPEFSNLVLDWIDKDDNVGTGGAESLDYLNLTAPNRPYRAANQPIASVSELRLMLAMSEDATNAKNDYAALVRPSFNPLNAVSLEAIEQQPLVNALPRGAKININTAPKAVLKALVDFVGVPDSEKVINEFDEKRKDQPQKDVNEFMKPIEDYVKSLMPPPGNAGTRSNTPENNKYKTALQSKDRLKADMIDVKSEYFYLTARSQIGDTDIMLISLLYRKDGKVKTLRRGLGVI